MRARRLWLVLMGLVVAASVAVSWALPFQYAGVIRTEARRHGLDPYLVAAVVRVESGFRADARSRQGAVGLMQLMPATARWVTTKSGIRGPLEDPAANVAYGSWYLHYLLHRYGGNLRLALAAYNSGPEVVDRWLSRGQWNTDADPAHIPYPETRAFVERVLWFRRLYRLVYGLWPGG
jgi:soluble lytic murein transglycosylase